MRTKQSAKPLAADPGSAVYEHFAGLIKSICAKAVRMGYDQDEVESAAGLAFLLAIDSYDPKKGKVELWIRFKVTKQIISLKRQRSYWRLPLTEDVMGPEFDAPDTRTQEESEDVTAALLGLSEDATAWVTLVLNPPKSVLSTAKALGWTPGDNTPIAAAAYRQAVFSWFRQAEWPDRRITRAYLEVCRAMRR